MIDIWGDIMKKNVIITILIFIIVVLGGVCFYLYNSTKVEPREKVVIKNESSELKDSNIITDSSLAINNSEVSTDDDLVNYLDDVSEYVDKSSDEKTLKGGVFDPGAAMAQAFAQGLGNKPPKIEIPKPKMSKSDQYVRDLMNFTCPVPSAGNTIKDERPETHDELIAKYHPVQINEVPPSKNVEFEYTGMNGMFIADAPITEIPYNGFPNIMI